MSLKELFAVVAAYSLSIPVLKWLIESGDATARVLSTGYKLWSPEYILPLMVWGVGAGIGSAIAIGRWMTEKDLNRLFLAKVIVMLAAWPGLLLVVLAYCLTTGNRPWLKCSTSEVAA